MYNNKKKKKKTSDKLMPRWRTIWTRQKWWNILNKFEILNLNEENKID